MACRAPSPSVSFLRCRAGRRPSRNSIGSLGPNASVRALSALPSAFGASEHSCKSMRYHRRVDVRTAIAWLCWALVASCGASHAREDVVTSELRADGWREENHARLERMLGELASRDGRRVAVFD